jgi:hypothetical protein
LANALNEGLEHLRRLERLERLAFDKLALSHVEGNILNDVPRRKNSFFALTAQEPLR